MKKKNILLICGSFVAMAVLLRHSAGAAAGARQGLTLCTDILLPCAYPFMVLSAVAAAGIEPGERGKGRLLARLLGAPPCALPAVLLSALGGYPVGAGMVAALYKKGMLTKEQGERLCLICFHPGVGFTVGVVGGALLRSPKTGAVLYIAITLASLAVAILTGHKEKTVQMPQKQGEAKRISLVTALTEGIKTGGKNTLTVCAWVILFGGLQGLIPQKIGALPVMDILRCLTEITGGAAKCAGWLPLPALGALLAFGGFCTHFQVFSISEKTGLRYGRFLGMRCAAAALTALFALLLFRIFPACAAVQTGATLNNAVLFSAGMPAGISLLFMSVIFVLGVDKKEKV